MYIYIEGDSMSDNIPSSVPPFLDSAFSLGTLYAIVGLILLSLFSLCFIFHLRFKSRESHHLQKFNSLWSVRFLLVFVITIWGLHELFRLSFFHRRYLYPFLPPLTLTQQANLCKIHVVLSLGFLEPSFLVILLFLVNISILEKTPRGSWVHAFLWATCIPIIIVQILFMFFSNIKMPHIFHRSSEVIKNQFGEETVICTYPLISCIIFGAFGVWYLVLFSLSCFKVLTLVINKGLRRRMYWLAFVVITMLPLEILFHILKVFWRPGETLYGAFYFLAFITTLLLAAVGEGILVIRPITDSLAVGGGDSCRLSEKQEESCCQRDMRIEVQSSF